MQVFFVNNEGGGYADTINIRDGISISDFFREKFPGRDASQFLIRVNRNAVDRNYTLQMGDKISITPTKIQGAMQVFFVNNEGGGYADTINVDDGLSIANFFRAKFPGREAAQFLIRVNRNAVDRNYILQPGDKISITPTKIQGA